MFTNVTVFSSLANIDSLPYNKSELCCRITRANIADMFAVMFEGVARGLVEKDGSGDTGIPGSSPAGGRLAVPG